MIGTYQRSYALSKSSINRRTINNLYLKIILDSVTTTIKNPNYTTTITASQVTATSGNVENSSSSAVAAAEALEKEATDANEQRQQQQEAARQSFNTMANSIGIASSSNNSNFSNSLVSSSIKHAASGDGVSENSNSNSSTFLFGFEDKQRVAYMKNVEKNIIEYISRVSLHTYKYCKHKEEHNSFQNRKYLESTTQLKCLVKT